MTLTIAKPVYPEPARGSLVVSDWIEVCTAPETADNSGSTIVAPGSITRSDQLIYDTHGLGQSVEICLVYDAGVSAVTNPVIQVFGADTGNQKTTPVAGTNGETTYSHSPLNSTPASWQCLVDATGAHETTLYIDPTNDVSENGFKRSRSVYVHAAACRLFLVGIKTAFAATGTVNNSKIQIRSSAREIAPRSEVSGNSATLKNACTVTTDVYTAGDSLFGLLTISAARDDQRGLIPAFVLQDAEGQKPTGTILVFDANPSASTFTANSTLVVHADDRTKVVASIPVVDADWLQCDASLWETQTLVSPAPIHPASGKNLYVAMRVSNTPDYAATTALRLNMNPNRQ